MLIFSEEPKGKTYEALVDLAAELCDEFILVKHLENDLDSLFIELDSFLVEVKQQQSWPGTELLKGCAEVYYYHLNSESKQLLKNYFEGLYLFEKSSAFQDLCFLKQGRKPWLITISHEQFAYIKNYNDYEIDKLESIEGIQFNII